MNSSKQCLTFKKKLLIAANKYLQNGRKSYFEQFRLIYLAQTFDRRMKKNYIVTNNSHHASSQCVPRWDFAFMGLR